jgi:transcriptional regulator GlxA family with amidase domain
MHRVVALALPNVVAFDLSIGAQVFGHREEEMYEFLVCAPAPGAVPTTTGFALLAEHGIDVLERAGTVLVPGFEDPRAQLPDRVLDALRAAGVLDGRRATTHWRATALLARRFPAIRVEPDVLYVDEGRVLTSAGVAAGIDLCLHIVRTDFGQRAANAIARRIVVAPQREGGQAQFLERPVPTEPGGSLESTRLWALEHLAEPLTVAELARHAGYSERTFARRFRAETGTTPLQWLIAQRTLNARGLLEGGELSVEAVARQCGFGSAPSLRQHFRRAVRSTPTAYRAAWTDAA